MNNPRNMEQTRFERRLLGLISPAGNGGLRIPERIGAGSIHALKLRPGLDALAMDLHCREAGFRFAWRSDRELLLLGLSRRGRSRLRVNGAELPDPDGQGWCARIAKGAEMEWLLPAGESLRELVYFQFRDLGDSSAPDPAAMDQPRIALLVDRLLETVAGHGLESLAQALLAYAWMTEASADGTNAKTSVAEAGGDAGAALPAGELRKIQQAHAILYREYLNPPTTIRLARWVALNEYKLKRGYRQVYGTSMHADLRRYRMRMARDLLLAGESSVAAAACAVGYSNPGHFARAFQAEFGVMPGRVARSNRLLAGQESLDPGKTGFSGDFHENKTQSQ